MVTTAGIEPAFADSESAVLPLDDVASRMKHAADVAVEFKECYPTGFIKDMSKIAINIDVHTIDGAIVLKFGDMTRAT